MTMLAIGIGLALGWLPYYLGLKQGYNMAIKMTKHVIEKEIERCQSK